MMHGQNHIKGPK